MVTGQVEHGDIIELGRGSASPAEAGRALESYRRDLNFLRQLQLPTPATRALLALLGGVFVLGYALTALVIEPRYGKIDESLYPIILLGAKINVEIQGGAWWRLVTNTLLHGGVLHLLFNGYALFVLGTIVERLVGTRRFIVIYGLAGLGGAVASYLFNDMASVGASGAIFGVFGAAIVFGIKHRTVLPPRVAHALSRGLFPWLLLSLAFGLLPMVDNAAHLGGLTAGTLAAAAMSTDLRGAAPKWSRTLALGVAVLLVVMLVASLVLAVTHGAGCLSDSEAWDACRAVDFAGRR